MTDNLRFEWFRPDAYGNRVRVAYFTVPVCEDYLDIDGNKRERTREQRAAIIEYIYLGQKRQCMYHVYKYFTDTLQAIADRAEPWVGA